MTMHILICALGSEDLLNVCLESIERFAGPCELHLIHMPYDTIDPAEHGRMIDMWRVQMAHAGEVNDDDVVVIMDPDVAILSDQWRVELERAFTDVRMAIWGAGAKEDFGPRVHASMMAIRGRVWNTLTATFTPCPDPRERTWRDTGGLYCLFTVAAGWRVQPLERGPDWHGVSAWWGMHDVNDYHSPMPLWAHLGGGSHSDPERMTRWQRLVRHQAILKRKAFINDVRALIASHR